jgi:hypothetical protein
MTDLLSYSSHSKILRWIKNIFKLLLHITLLLSVQGQKKLSPPCCHRIIKWGGGGQFSTAHLDIYGGVPEYGHAHPCRGLPSAQYSIDITYALQRQNAENLKHIFSEKEYRGLSPNFHIHVFVAFVWERKNLRRILYYECLLFTCEQHSFKCPSEIF